MSRSYVSRELRRRVAEQANHRCGYCLTQERVIGTLMDVEHIIPEARGGQTVEDNLWLACSDCNQHKGKMIEANDPLTGELLPLFDPRHHLWGDHFVWTQDGTEIVGLTPTGSATIGALGLNRSPLVVSRRMWVSAGWHPPEDV